MRHVRSIFTNRGFALGLRLCSRYIMALIAVVNGDKITYFYYTCLHIFEVKNKVINTKKPSPESYLNSKKYFIFFCF